MIEKNKLKSIDIAKGNFDANGKTYYIENEVSIARSVVIEIAKLELERGLRVGKQTEDWKKVYDLLNAGKVLDAGVIAYNNLKSFGDFFKHKQPVLKLCACFMNTAEEDRTQITEEMIQKKIDDWTIEGLIMADFFALALTFLKVEVEGYESATRNILEIIKIFNEKMAHVATGTSI